MPPLNVAKPFRCFNGELADIKVTVGDRVFNVHMVVLVRESTWFAKHLGTPLHAVSEHKILFGKPL